jgi:peptidase C25-like protein/dockerin type I repeat protein
VRKFFVCVLILFVGILSAAWIETGNSAAKILECENSSQNETNIAFNLEGFELNEESIEGTAWQVLSHPEAGELLEIGKPDIPVFSGLVAVPKDAEIEVIITDIREEVITDVMIKPQGELILESEGGGEQFTIDQAFYTEDIDFPGELAMTGELAVLRDFTVVNLTIQPFQYNPAKRELRVVRSMKIRVITRSNEPIRGERNLSRGFEPIYKATIINYDQVIQRPEYQLPCYLFIYPNNTTVANNLDYLVDWKREKGFEVHTASTSLTGTSTTSIKNYIQSAYDNWENPPEYVCLVGDHGGSYNIPTWFENWSNYNGEGDQPYSQLEGNDILADVMVGRLPFNNTSELQTLISKIINYESNPYTGNTNWYRRALLVGDPASSGQSTIVTCKTVKEMIQESNSAFNFNEIYSGDYDGLMNSGLNTGVSVMCYRGWMGMSGWDNNDINSLSNGFMLPFATILTCATGGFSGNNCRSEYFAKAGTSTNPKGAIGAIGTATTGTHTCFNNSVTLGIHSGIYQEDIFSMGGSLVRGKLNLYMCYPQNPSYAVNIFSHWNSLMGDPGLELFTGIPRDIVVSHADEINSGLEYLVVDVSLLSGLGLENAWVSLVQSNQSVSSYTNTDGSVFVPLANLNNGEVTITVTGHNCLPYQSTIDIVNTASLVTAESFVIDDDSIGNSQGNNDGVCNAGETIELWLDMHNYGTATEENVSMYMRTTSSFITALNSTVNFGDIEPGETVTSPEPYIMAVGSETPGGVDIQFSMAITSDGNGWVDALELPVSGPMLDYDHYNVIGGNSILDPGETSEMYITLENIGNLSAYGVSATIDCADDRITIVDNYGSFGTIYPGSSGNNNSNRFQITADSQILPGSQIPISLSITTDNYYTNTSFLLSIGTVNVSDPLGADAYGYYIYDDDDDEYSIVPMYNWFEIDPAYGGPGTDTGIYSSVDQGQSVVLDLPFLMHFYGVIYDQITVCSNGWAAPGVSEQEGFMNWRIPGPGGPSPMIAAFWDDLKCTSGNVCYYYDYVNHRYIIEWSRLQNENGNAEETFQIIIRNPLYYPTPTGDSEILIMYNEVNNVNSGNYRADHGQYCTVGIEDQSGTIGLEYTYNNTYPDAAKTLEDEMALLITTNSPAILEPPIAVLNAEDFIFVLDPGEVSYQSLQITNDGEASLVYSIIKDYLSSRNSGGPDGYGYMWFDSDEPEGPEFDWLDISGYGTQANFTHNDEATDLIDIGFSFNFYGEDYTQFRINPNGWIGFGDDNTAWQNLIMPNSEAPRPALCPFWDDLNPEIDGSGAGEVYYHSDGNQLIIMFDGVDHFSGQNNGNYDFEVIINSDGGIKFQYHELEGDIDTATIGIQNESGNDGLCMVYNNNYIQADMAIEFYKIIDWLDVSQTNGIIASGQTVDITLTADSDDLEGGEYSCYLQLATNDPQAAVFDIPVNMNVGGQNILYGDIDGNGEVESFDASISLQYFVGMDPLPEIDPLPWEVIRIIRGDVDGNGSVESFDASLILQYFVGIIDEFPVEQNIRRKNVEKDLIIGAKNDVEPRESKKAQNLLYKK